MFDEYQKVFEAAREISTTTSKNLKVKIQLDEAIFTEAFMYAESSCKFHGEEGEVNHIKKASHICFWLVKLKPFSIKPFIKDTVLKKSGLEEIADMVDGEYLVQKKKALEAPINEIIALSLASFLISLGFKNIEQKLAKVLKDNPSQRAELDLKNMKDRFAENRRRLSGLFGDIVRSYREHNYTSRALATMLHLAYSTGHESRHSGNI